jgi:acetylglutamate kinase
LTRTGAIVIKFGGELIETPDARAGVAVGIAVLARTRPVLVVHGGGRAIDAELALRGITPKKADGLRITDADTLETVVSVLAGSTNTQFVAALVSAGVRAVGLTGADAACGRAARALPLQSTSGATVDLGLVGDPTDADPALFELLMANNYVPVVASIGIQLHEGADTIGGMGVQTHPASLLNINADAMACRIAAALGASELVIAGTTAGVLDGHGRTMPTLDTSEIDALIASGAANAGMVAKLRACREALRDGVISVRIVDGRDNRALSGDFAAAPGTMLTTAMRKPALQESLS